MVAVLCVSYFSPSFYKTWSTRAAPEVMSPILLCWLMTSEADVSCMAVDTEPSCQYSITCCCCVTDGSRGTYWHNSVWRGSTCEATACHWIPPRRRNCNHWHSLMLAEYLWRPNSGCEHNEAQWGTMRHNEAMGGVFQQWWRWQRVTPADADF